jgi:signal-transduction protein with cAMP-binding, CBS, and nucleotidyltransferase domain
MTEQLQQHITTLLPGFTLPVAAMAPFFSSRKVKKGEVLLNENETCDTIYFVNKGCLYLYYDQKGQQEVIHFALENWWITDYKTFAGNKPAVYCIAAMEDSVLTCMSRKNYEELQLQFPPLALYFNKIHERAYGAALFKQKVFATVSKADFYRQFRNTYPSFFQRIPDIAFAAYIGVSTEILKTLEEQYIS